MTSGNGGEKLWKWIVRGCAVFGFVVYVLTAHVFHTVPSRPEFVVILIGLFGLPDFVKRGSSVRISLEDKDKKDEPVK